MKRLNQTHSPYCQDFSRSRKVKPDVLSLFSDPASGESHFQHPQRPQREDQRHHEGADRG